MTSVSEKKVVSAAFGRCTHIQDKKVISLFDSHLTLQDVFEAQHPPLDQNSYTVTAKFMAGEMSFDVPIGDVVDIFKVNSVAKQRK